jgi:hypothetical protein
MAGDGGRAPDVSEQRSKVEAVYVAMYGEPGERGMDDDLREHLEAIIVALDAARATDPASVLAALLAEHPDATIAALETLLTSDEAVEAGASTIVEQDLLMRTDDSLMGALEVLIDPAREMYEDAIAAACRSLRPKAPKEDDERRH